MVETDLPGEDARGSAALPSDLTLTEWSRSGPTELSEDDLEMIETEVNADCTQLDYQYERGGGVSLRTTHYVGIVSPPDGPTVEIRPSSSLVLVVGAPIPAISH